MQRSAEYQAVCKTVYQAAAQLLRARLLARPAEAAGRVPAVVMDLDETVLDNSGFEAYLQHIGSGYQASLWEAWVAYQASCPEGHPNRAVPGAVDFIHAMQAAGVEVIFISNRSAAGDGAKATARILRQLGLALPRLEERIWLLESKQEEARRARELLARLKLAEDSEQGKAVLAAQGRKERRRVEAGLRYWVMACFGDDLYDFPVYVPAAQPPGPALVELRRGGAERSDPRWGTTWFALPNPVYGSWLQALGKGDAKSLLDDQGFGDHLRVLGPQVKAPAPSQP
jgi:predicted secreted acid phosphatase